MSVINIPGPNGSSTAPNPAGKPRGIHQSTWLKIEQIARYRIAGVNNRQIAALLNTTDASLNQILQMPEYKETEEALMLGHLTEMDKALAGKIEPLRNELRSAVPSALRCLMEVANQRRDLKAAFAASCEILDRDPDRVANKKGASQGENDIPTIPDSILDNAAKEGEAMTSKEKKLPIQ